MRMEKRRYVEDRYFQMLIKRRNERNFVKLKSRLHRNDVLEIGT